MLSTSARYLKTFALILTLFCTGLVRADITTFGDVDPTPNADGGNLNGLLSVGLGVNSGPNAGATTVGSMRIDSGTELIVDDGVVGNRRGSHGSLEVSGLGTQWLIEDDVAVGNDGYGDLTISNEAWVANGDDFIVGADENGRGWVDVIGPRSLVDIGDTLTIGSLGIGNLKLDTRSRVLSDDGFIGAASNSVGDVDVGGQSSWVITSNLIVGDSGSGRLNIHSGGIVDNASAILSDESSGRGMATVTGVGSLWLSRDDLTVGDNNSAELTIEDNGTVQANDDIIVRQRGAIRLAGGNLIADSITNAGIISGAGRVAGTVSISETGSLQANRTTPLVIESAVTNSGGIDVVGGNVQFQTQVTNEEAGTISGNGGVLRFRGGLLNNGKLGFVSGATDIFGEVATTSTGSIQVGGEGTATFHGAVTNAGTLRVDPESHAIFLQSLTSSSQTELVGVASGEPGFAPKLSVSGTLQVDGTLSIIPSSDPELVTEPGERGSEVVLALANAVEIGGEFSQVEYDGSVLSPLFLLDERSFRSYDRMSSEPGIFRTIAYTETTLDVINYWALEGDTDGDQDVDFGDFLITSGNFGQSGVWTDGDFDGDGTVAFGDFLALSTNFGLNGGLAVQAVPEPSTHITLLAGFALVMMLRRRPAVRR